MVRFFCIQLIGNSSVGSEFVHLLILCALRPLHHGSYKAFNALERLLLSTASEALTGLHKLPNLPCIPCLLIIQVTKGPS